jgi:hypothetical protein
MKRRDLAIVFLFVMEVRQERFRERELLPSDAAVGRCK